MTEDRFINEWDEFEEDDEPQDMYLDEGFASWDDFNRYMYG